MQAETNTELKVYFSLISARCIILQLSHPVSMPGMYSKLTIIFQYNYCILLLTATICSLYEFDEERINRRKKLMYSKEI